MSAYPLLFVPGLLCSARLFDAQATALVPGYKVQIANHTTADTMPGVAEAILSEAPDEFTLIGLSMGGYVSFEILRQAPGRVRRLVLLDTQARADTEEIIANRHRLLELADREGAVEVQRELLPKLIRQDRVGEEPLTSEILKMAEEVGNDGFRNQTHAIIGRPDSRDMLGTIACPTLIIVGDQDILTPPDRSREMAEGIDGAELRIIPDCGHLSTMEAPDAVNGILSDWLQS